MQVEPEQTLFVVNNKSRNLKHVVPEQYKVSSLSTFPEILTAVQMAREKQMSAERRVAEARKRDDNDYQEVVFFLVLAFCYNSEDLEQVGELRYRYPDIPIIVSTLEPGHASLIALHECASMAIDFDTEAFRRAEEQAYDYALKLKKTG